MSTASGVTTSFRLSRYQAKLIRIGLLRVTSGHYLWKERGSPSCSPSRMLFHPSRIDEGEYDPEYLATISRVIATATGSFTASSRRLRLDPFEAAACHLGVRLTEMLFRHGHAEGWLRNHTAATRKLLAKLERVRKRAKRSFVRAHGHTVFTEASRRWQDFVRFVRAYFLFCTCNRPRLPGGGAKAWRRPIVEWWIEKFRRELPVAGLRVPPDKELRSLVRRGLRSARRHMADMGLTEVREEGESLRERIRNFVVSRCREQQEVSPPSVKRYRIRNSKLQRRREMKKVKTEAQAETSNMEYLAGNSKTAKAQEPVDGSAKTPALPDAQFNLDRERDGVSGSTGIPSADAVQAIQAEDPDLARLRADWPSLAPLDRTERLKVLIAKKHSRRALARAIGRSEGSVRHYLSFSLLTDEDKQALQQGSLSGKEARKTVHEGKVRERLAQVRLSQQEWTKEIERLVRVSLDWFGSLGLAKAYLKQLMYELSGGEQNIRLREFRQHAPALWEIPIGKDAQEVIASCRPKGDPASMFGPEYVNWCFIWCARWTQRLMPDPKLRNTVLHLGARQLQLL